jgi:hypothetical protein
MEPVTLTLIFIVASAVLFVVAKCMTPHSDGDQTLRAAGASFGWFGAAVLTLRGFELAFVAGGPIGWSCAVLYFILHVVSVRQAVEWSFRFGCV